jgi:hypothetical protein
MKELANRILGCRSSDGNPLALAVSICFCRLDKQPEKRLGDDDITKEKLGKIMPAKAAFIHKGHMKTVEQSGEGVGNRKLHVENVEQLTLK